MPLHPAVLGRGRRTRSRAVRIRRRRDRDLGAVARLLRLLQFEGSCPSHPAGHPTGRPQDWLTSQDIEDAWIAKRAGLIAGHVAVSQGGHDLEAALRWRELTGQQPTEIAAVAWLFVRPRFRGQGIGTSLLDVAVDRIRERGLSPVLEVLDPGTDTQAFLEHRGWRLRANDRLGDSTSGRHVHRYTPPISPHTDGLG